MFSVRLGNTPRDELFSGCWTDLKIATCDRTGTVAIYLWSKVICHKYIGYGYKSYAALIQCYCQFKQFLQNQGPPTIRGGEK